MASIFKNFTFLAKNKNKTARLRLVRTYPRYYQSNTTKISGHDFIFHDVKGQRIHGWVPGCLSQKYKEFKLLEGNVYEITNFEFVEDKSAFKITKSSHKFIFYKQTNMREIVDDEYPSWVPGCLSQKFKEFKLLEGNVYEITNFEFVEDKSAFKITKSSHKFIFYKQTNMREIVDDEYPRFMFEFKQFRELTDPETIDPCTPFAIISGHDFIFHDVKGQRIHSWVPGCLSQKFKEFKLLEGNVYEITNFEFVEDKSAFKITKSSHKFIFYKQTNMREIVDDEYPRFMFEFKQFRELTDPETIDPCTPFAMASIFKNLTFLAKNKNKIARLRLGQRIHGWVPGCLSQKFKEFKLLEGNVYEITNFEFVEDKSAFKITKSSHEFIFYKQTNMREIVDDEYPRLMFEFKQFRELTDPETIDPCTPFGNVYEITNFEFVEDKSAFKITKSSHKFIFYKQTNMCEIVDDEYPRLMFEFKQFMELTDPETIDPCTPFDMIDCIVLFQNIHTRNLNGGQKRCVDIVLEDVEGCHQTCTLWEGYADMLIAAYKKSFMSNVCDDLQSGIAPIIKVAYFCASKEEKKFWICGHIIDIWRDWFFNSCPNCVRKVERKEERFWCNYCKDSIPFAILRYKLHILVGDNTGMVLLLCWDKVARELVGKPCDAVDNDGSDLPLDLELLTHEVLLFTVSKKKDQFGSYIGLFTVSRITADHILDSDQPSTLMKEYYEAGQESKDEDTVPGCEITGKRVQKKLFEDGSSCSGVEPKDKKIKVEKI
ncbi:replication protein A 70 kDa DNA-binding subunit [Striga asiatica]|uniref:Replication protein A 70 kDa DNA-binding subunit n=1 Tax=Striga asiatica TaxID=4170 RepID=A0A5A7PM10_STRAF|nr:replication protein A 70 kDa DNA-binding subunit [Striga asiatica]